MRAPPFGLAPVALTLLSGALLAACSTVETPPEAPAFEGLGTNEGLREKIVNGRVERGFPAVGALELGGGGLCTGTVIAERWVISAAHCFGGGFAGGNLVLGDSIFAGNAQRVRLRRAVVHPQYNPQTNANDIALIELASPAGVAPVPVARDLSGITGQTLKWVGFGITSGAGQDSGTKRSVDLTVTQLNATTLESREAGRNACRGDSGGPAMRITNGAVEVAGITSWGDQDCLELTVNTRVDAFLAFIEQTINGGAADPGNVGGPDPQPADPGAGLDCEGLLDCAGGCGDDACLQACGQRATAQAIAGYNALAQCAQANGCQDWDCVDQRCGAELDACLPGQGGLDPQQPDPAQPDPAQPDPQQPDPDPAPAPAPGGGGSCGALLTCAQQCGGDRNCLTACAAAAAPASVDAYNRLAGCAFSAGCGDMGCVEQVCGAELAACTGGAANPAPDPGVGAGNPAAPGAGGQSCAEIFLCFDGCGPQEACYEACFQRGSAQAQAQVVALDECAWQANCQDMSCVEARCGGELQACFGF